MVPPATALTHNKAICAAARHTAASSAQIGSARSSHRRAAAGAESVQQRLQGPAYRGFAGVGPEGGGGHAAAAAAAAAAGRGFKEALHRQWSQCRSDVVVAKATVFEKRARTLALLRDQAIWRCRLNNRTRSALAL